MTRHRSRSRLRMTDTIAESWLQISRRPGRAFMTALGVALGSAAIVATLSLVTTIRFQVSDEFDALRATQVELRTRDDQAAGAKDGSSDSSAFPPPASDLDRTAKLTGITGIAAIRETDSDQTISLNQVIDPTAVPTRAPVYGLNAEGLRALDASFTGPGWDRWHDQQQARVVAVPRRLAIALDAPELDVGDRVFINGLSFSVVAIIDTAPRLPGLLQGFIIPATTSDLFPLAYDRDRLIAITLPGAAPQIARVLPTAIAPTAPDRWTAYAPSDDGSLRQAVDDQIRLLSLGLGAIVLLLGAVSISNATLTSVLQRIHEIGLRRALGARPRHIAAHILLDAATLGAVGGALGAILGTSATLAVSALQGWRPVIDPLIPAAAVLGGLLAGTLAGAYPARAASRLQPTEALRRD